MSAPFRFPKFFVTNPSPCPYLPGKVERKVFTELNGPQLRRAQRGARPDRFPPLAVGRLPPVVHRLLPPASRSACCADEFTPSATQRKLIRRHADLEVSACKPWTTEEQYALLRRYLAQRHPGGGMAEMDEQRLRRHGRADAGAHLCHRISRAVGRRPPGQAGRRLPVSDQQGDGLRMIYSFYDVGDGARKGLGTYIILDHIIRAARAGLPYVYLGYWVEGSDRMAYKASFRPMERLGRDGWRRMDAPDAICRCRRPADALPARSSSTPDRLLIDA